MYTAYDSKEHIVSSLKRIFLLVLGAFGGEQGRATQTGDEGQCRALDAQCATTHHALEFIGCAWPRHTSVRRKTDKRKLYHVLTATGCYYRARHSPWRAMCRQPALARSGALHPALVEGVDSATTITSNSCMQCVQQSLQLTKRAETATRLGRKSTASARPACKPTQVTVGTQGQLESCINAPEAHL